MNTTPAGFCDAGTYDAMDVAIGTNAELTDEAGFYEYLNNVQNQGLCADLAFNFDQRQMAISMRNTMVNEDIEVQLMMKMLEDDLRHPNSVFMSDLTAVREHFLLEFNDMQGTGNVEQIDSGETKVSIPAGCEDVVDSSVAVGINSSIDSLNTALTYANYLTNTAVLPEPVV